MMKAKVFATLTTLALTVFAASLARADDAELAWQQPGYVMEVVIVTGSRPAAPADTDESSDGSLAWQQPGYVEEVVVVTASRKEAIEAMLRIERPALPARPPFLGVPAR